MEFMIVLLAVILGLVVGSFLTVVVDRIATGEQIVWGRSHCPQCRRPLRWFELVPVVSFIVQKGACRSCRNKIPKLYLAIELASCALFAGLAWGLASHWIQLPQFLASGSMVEVFPFAPGLGVLAIGFLYYAVFGAIAIAISAYDVEHHLIPWVLASSLIGLGIANILGGWLRFHDTMRLLETAAVAASAFLLFFSLWFFSRGKAMGRGDADIGLAIALLLAPGTGVLALVLAFWLGSLWGILGVVGGKLGFKSEIPFAPFLFFGAIGALFLEPLVRSYFLVF